jgi:hypothetical protein
MKHIKAPVAFNLIIRQTKKKSGCLKNIRKIISRLHLLERIDDKLVVITLVRLCDQYSLVQNWKRFFLDVDPDRDLWWGGKQKGWQEAIIDDLITLIRHTDVVKFGDDFTTPLSTKNFYKNLEKK